MANRCEMCIVGLKRSGNHAVINWIGQQCTGEKVYFLNNCRPFESPYETKHSEDSAETIIFKDYRVDRAKQRFDDKDYLLYSYEDRSLGDVFSDFALSNHDRWVGASEKRYDILLLRDPFNLFASRLQRDLHQQRRDSTLQPQYLNLKSLWKEYAREFIGASEYLKNNKVVISFNSWSRDVRYRRELALQLGLEFSDAGKDEVVGIGGGSSFDGQVFDGAGHSMAVTERWRRFASHSLYRQLMCDDELLELTTQIFGTIPGTEQWMSNAAEKST